MAIGDKNLTDDTFWLNMGAEVIYGSLQARKDAVDRLQKTIAWVFGVYTSISFATVLFGDKKTWDIVALVIFGFAFFFLIVAYWLATLAAFPTLEDFFSNAVDSIKPALAKALKNNSEYFNWAVITSGIGTFLYSIAVLTQFSAAAWHKPKVIIADLPITVKTVKNNVSNSFTISIASKTNSWHELMLVHTAIVSGKTKIDTINIDGKTKSIFLLSDSTGSAHFTLPTLKDDAGNSLIVTRIDSLNGEDLIYTKKIRYKIN